MEPNKLSLCSTIPARVAFYDTKARLGVLSSTALTKLSALAVPSPTLDRNGKATNLDARSADNLAMLDYWDQVDAIIRGSKAIRDAGEKYLPKFPDEPKDDYEWRLQMTKFTNVFRDICEGLASRPFETAIRVDMRSKDDGKPVDKPVKVDPPEPEVDPVTGLPKPVDKPPAAPAKPKEEALPEQIAKFIEDVDGNYNSITEIGASLFFQALVDAVTWIFVDYPDAPNEANPDGTPKLRSVEDEKAMNLRPFWTHVLGRNVLEARSALIDGNEVLNYVRVLETQGTDTFVRVMYRDFLGARWELWKQDKKGVSKSGSTETKWDLVDQGVFSIGLIPMVPFVIGRRRGRTQYYFPAMRDAADLQIELYWQESGLKFIKTLAAFPMLAGNGVKPRMAADGKTVVPLRIKPMAALYAPPDGQGTSGSWSLLEPSATSLTFLQSDVEKTINQLRELGRNPLTAQSGNLTVVTTMVAAKKGNSAVQMWAVGEENALDIALYYTALWFGIEETTADRIQSHMFTDFDIDGEGGEALTALKGMRDAGDLSQRTYWKEMQRRDVLSGDFDADAEEAMLLDEGPTDDGTMIDPITGKMIPGAPVIALPNPNKPGGNQPPGNKPPFGGKPA